MKKQRKCSSILSLKDIIMIFRGSLAKKTTKRPNRSRSSTWDPQGVKSFVHNLLHEELNILENLHLSHWEKKLKLLTGEERTQHGKELSEKSLWRWTRAWGNHPCCQGWSETPKQRYKAKTSIGEWMMELEKEGERELSVRGRIKATKWFLKGD